MEPRQPSDPPERSRSCDGRIEASSVHAKNHTRKPISLCTDRPKISRSSSFLETRSGPQSRRPRDQEIPDFLLLERLVCSAKEEKNKDTLVEKSTIEDRTGKPDLVTKSEIDDVKASILPLSTLNRKKSKASISTVPVCTVLSKRCFEEDDEAIPIITNSKKPRRRDTNPLKCSQFALTSIKLEEKIHQNTGPSHFVSALDKFNEIMPSCDATRRFQDNPKWCLANKKCGLRCHAKISVKKHGKIRQLLADLGELNIFVKFQECLDRLVEFTKLAVCARHREDLIRKERAAAIPPTTLSINVTYWLREPPSHALHYLPKYQPYHSPERYPRSKTEWVVEKAKMPLSIGRSRDFRGLDEGMDGYLYVYWNRASFGLVKIGCTGTGVGVDQRLQVWETQCRHVVEEHYRSPFKIKHALRVEKLIHTEFRDHRVSESKCRGCGDTHIEWFRGLDLGFLIKRMEAWTEWIMKEPYEEKSGVWVLKHGRETTIPQICPAPNETDNSKNGKASIAKTSPRYNLRPRRAPGSSQSPPPSTRT